MSQYEADLRPLGNRRGAVLCVFLVAVVALVSGCSLLKSPGSASGSAACSPVTGAAPPAVGNEVAIITAERRNSSPVASLPQSLCDAISQSAQAQRPIALIRLDGRPEVLGTSVFQTDSKNSAARHRDLNAYISSMAQSVVKVKAQEPDVDVRAALDLAAKEIHQGGADLPGTIYVLGSALQEIGSPDFASAGMLDADPKEVINFLRTQSLLPDLTHINVIFVGFDATAAPQAALNTAQSANFKNIWRGIVNAGGAAYTDFLPAPSTSNSVPDADQLPPVKTVKLLPPPAWTPNQRYPDSGPLHFEPDTAVLTDPGAARVAMARVPAWLNTHLRCSLGITGTTARVGDRAGQVALARDRAATVKQIIVSLGGNGAQITVAGLGSYFADYVPDHDPRTGALIPDRAEQNRSVYFQPKC